MSTSTTSTKHRRSCGCIRVAMLMATVLLASPCAALHPTTLHRAALLPTVPRNLPAGRSVDQPRKNSPKAALLAVGSLTRTALHLPRSIPHKVFQVEPGSVRAKTLDVLSGVSLATGAFLAGSKVLLPQTQTQTRTPIPTPAPTFLAGSKVLLPLTLTLAEPEREPQPQPQLQQ